MSLPTLSHYELLLRIHWSPNAVDFGDARQMAIARSLVGHGLVALCGNGFETTERGDVLVNAIRNLPLPVQSWRMP